MALAFRMEPSRTYLEFQKWEYSVYFTLKCERHSLCPLERQRVGGEFLTTPVLVAAETQANDFSSASESGRAIGEAVVLKIRMRCHTGSMGLQRQLSLGTLREGGEGMTGVKHLCHARHRVVL